MSGKHPAQLPSLGLVTAVHGTTTTYQPAQHGVSQGNCVNRLDPPFTSHNTPGGHTRPDTPAIQLLR